MFFAFTTGETLLTALVDSTLGALLGNNGAPDGVVAGCTEGFFVAKRGAADTVTEGFDTGFRVCAAAGAIDGVPTGLFVFEGVGAMDDAIVGLLGRSVDGEAEGEFMGNPVEFPKFKGSLHRREDDFG